MSNFSKYHPIVIFIYYISVIVITMIIMNPVVLVISLLSSLILNLLIESSQSFFKSVIFYLFLFILIIILNPLFSQNGNTTLFMFKNIKVTLESLFYGFMIASMLVAVLFWFRTYNQVMTSDKFIYLFGRIAPSIALILSMGIKLIPVFKRQVIKINHAQKGLGLYSNKGIVGKMKNGLNTFSILVTWSLENSIDTADSMKARGYGLKGRTTFSIFKFRKSDLILLSIISSLITLILIKYGLGVYEFTFYPDLTIISLDLKNILNYFIIFILMLIPSFIEIKEKIKWLYLKSKI